MEDLNILSGFKNLIILNPANETELNYVYQKFKNHNGPIYFRINKSQRSNSKNIIFKKKGNFFIKKGLGSNVIISGKIFDYLKINFTESALNKLNIISMPIFNYNFSKNIYSFINKNKQTLFLVDNKQTFLFEKMKHEVSQITNQSVWNLDLEPTKVSKVGDELDILKQSGFHIKNLRKFLLK